MFYKIRSLRHFILAASLLASLLLFGTSYWLFSRVYQQSMEESAKEQAQALARASFQTMTQIMFQGWSRQQLLEFIQSLQGSFADTRLRIDLYRGERVSARFGELPQPEPDQHTRQALREGTVSQMLEQETARFIYPLLASERCIGCHDNARPGDVLGVMEVRHDLAPLLRSGERRFLVAGLLLAPLPLLIAWLLVRSISRRLDRGLAQIRDKVAEIHCAEDLQSLKLEEHDLGYREIAQIFEENRAITEKFRGLVVDRDLLEFEFRLLEKFVITSEVINDWHEHIKEMLVEINRITTAYTLFSIFKGDEEFFHLEIFWLHSPPQDLSERVVGRIKRLFTERPQFKGIGLGSRQSLSMEKVRRNATEMGAITTRSF